MKAREYGQILSPILQNFMFSGLWRRTERRTSDIDGVGRENPVLCRRLMAK
jgi:hypothetical protein